MRTLKLATTLSLAATVAVGTSMTAQAASPQYETVTSQSGVATTAVAPAEASDAEMTTAIEQHQRTTQAAPAAASPSAIAATGDYYSYCEEGSSGMMVWTNNAPSNCYGWYYEYLDGQRVSKVNMLQLKANDPGLSGQQEQRLIDWCNANGFYCNIASALIPFGAGKVGKYLLKLVA
ncbi:hypothetical protein WDZ16_01305 [Pseudokineococcus marinus]|uniref:Uncharacterized protein n=1 Tax=Pseudokineococcus marinus TaxID=351215 RepID=A0A849BKA0_9ACTN|nr:hypothetical protein [Pseudokineococcus marinus]NNH21517.1 hypothetical protein [Pseudokineococcus marinus]